MLQEIILAGFGGQGVMSMGQLLSYAGMVEEKHVSWIPSYGPEMRGGTANCSVVISDTPVSSPIIHEPNCLIVLNRPSLDKFENSVQPGGLLMYNSSLIEVIPHRQDIRCISIPATELANNKLGNPRVANMVLLGAFIEITKVVGLESIVGALRKVLPEYRHHLIPLNRQAFDLGISFVQ